MKLLKTKAPDVKPWHAPAVNRRLLVALACCALFGAPAVGAAEPDHGLSATQDDDLFTRHIEGAARLEGRILAPCCWDTSRQTIDIHGSPIALQLRREIRTRLLKGETPDAIEGDLVRRYGPKILAVPEGNPLRQLAVVMSIGMLFAGAGAAVMLVRWKRRGAERAAAERKELPPPNAQRDQWDERLEAELRETD